MGDAASVLRAVQRVREMYERGSAPPTDVLAALMVIEDAVQAIDAYVAHTQFATTGEAYLSKFGLLQAFQLGFDAAECVGKALGVRLRADKAPGGKSVLVARNLVAGHPIGGSLQGRRWNHFHDRSTALENEVIRVMSFRDTQSDIWTGQTVRVGELISDGLGVLSALLERAERDGSVAES